MTVSVACPTQPGTQYRPLLDALRVLPDEEVRVIPLLTQLDGLDGVCDGKLSPLQYEQLRSAAEKINALVLPPQRRLDVHSRLTKFLVADDFAAFISRPYHELLALIEKNPVFAPTILPHIQPGKFWSDELATKAQTIRESPQEFSVGYPKLLDTLYDRTGLSQLNSLIDKAESARLREASSHSDDAALFVGKNTTNSASTDKLAGCLSLPELPDRMRVDPALIPTLKVHKDRAEMGFVSALLEMAGTLPDVLKKDPLTYWMPIVKLAASEPELSDKTSTHYEVLQSLYTKARALAYDDVMGILFDVEFAEYIGDPMDIVKLDQKIGAIRREIKGVDQQHYLLPDGQTESDAERLGRYYSAIGHLLTRKYGVAISSMTPNPLQIARIEAEVDHLLQERRDKTMVDEALVYADTVNIIVSAWAAENGMMSQKLVTEGLPATREELKRLDMLQKRFETLCNGHYIDPIGGNALREKMADIRWKVFGEGYFRAGLPRQGLENLDSEPHKFQSTKAYVAHVRALGDKYPWLVDNHGSLNLGDAGPHGKKAEAITEVLFYSSREKGREVALPVVGAAVGSLGGPLGSFVGGYAGKSLNRIINSSSADAREISSQARATGIPLISENLSEQLTHSEYIDLA